MVSVGGGVCVCEPVYMWVRGMWCQYVCVIRVYVCKCVRVCMVSVRVYGVGTCVYMVSVHVCGYTCVYVCVHVCRYVCVGMCV